MNTSLQSIPKLCIGLALCFAIRLFPWRPPNMEPILATMMPFGKHVGALWTFLFGFLNILLFDAFTAGIGSWTFSAGLTYGLIGALSAWWFTGQKTGPLQYAAFSLPAVLLFDGITGVLLAPLWGTDMYTALIGQIPFTVNHLLSTLVLALTLSPLVERFIAHNPRLEWRTISASS